MFEDLWLVREERDLEEFIENVLDIDLIEHTSRQRRETVWKVYAVTNLTFYLYKMVGIGKIGAPLELPDYIANHKGMLTLQKNRRGELYEDNLCFFRALALLKDCTCASRCRCNAVSEKTTKQLFVQYIESLPSEDRSTFNDFKGITFDDMLRCESLFEVSIIVLRLLAAEDGTLRSNVVWTSMSKHKKRLYLNMHDSHFSYIKRMDLFCRTYDCEVCKGGYKR